MRNCGNNFYQQHMRRSATHKQTVHQQQIVSAYAVCSQNIFGPLWPRPLASGSITDTIKSYILPCLVTVKSWLLCVTRYG